MRVLDSRNITVRDELVLKTTPGPFRFVWRAGAVICDDGPDTLARVVNFAIESGSLTGKTVAWIGGGFCVGPRVFAISDCKQTVYEKEHSLFEFCPLGIRFVGGDWHDTIDGELYDIIVYDIAEIPYDELRPHLKPGGRIVPEEKPDA